MPDIDIDFANRDLALSEFDYIVASRNEHGVMKAHNTGVYFTNIPVDAFSNRASIDYKEAESRGYFKIDFLNASVYKGVTSEEHLIQLMNTEPVWELLEQDQFCNLVFHLNGYSNIVRTMQPKTIEQLAAVLAIIRPAKKYLIGKPWTEVMQEVWTKPDNDEYYFKKSHAHSYAALVVVHMNLLCEQIEAGELVLD